MAQYSKFAEINNKEHNIEGKLDHLKGRSNVSGMEFNSENCKVMHLGLHIKIWICLEEILGEVAGKKHYFLWRDLKTGFLV